MLIDPYSPDVAVVLRQHHAALPPGAQLSLLIDGVCVPGLWRDLSEHDPILLFASLPGCSEAARDVSPFVVRYDPDSAALARVVKRCSGWPMLSTIATHETPEQLAQRLGAWCVVAVSGQRFNFRFPDTRRLPAIFATLTDSQRAEMIGNALSWRYVGRDGGWHGLAWTPPGGEPPLTVHGELDDTQFGRLVSDSEADEMWVRLQDRGVRSRLTPSRRHALLASALELARQGGLDQLDAARWCSACMGMEESDITALTEQFSRWILENRRTNDATSPTVS